MKITNVYNVNVFKNGVGNSISDFVVRMKTEGRPTIRISADKLLMLKSGDEVNAMNTKIRLVMTDLGHIIINDTVSNEYDGFHEMREFVRHYLKKYRFLHSQLEEINSKLALTELREYIEMVGDQRNGFSKFYKERFPEKSKQKYSYNIGYMLDSYRNIFNKEEIPKEEIVYYEMEFRTRDRGYGDYYSYPIKVKHSRMEASYITKVAVCTIFELGVVA